MKTIIINVLKRQLSYNDAMITLNELKSLSRSALCAKLRLLSDSNLDWTGFDSYVFSSEILEDIKSVAFEEIRMCARGRVMRYEVIKSAFNPCDLIKSAGIDTECEDYIRKIVR